MTNNPLVLPCSCTAALALVCAVSYCWLAVHLLSSVGERYLFRLEVARGQRREPPGVPQSKHHLIGGCQSLHFEVAHFSTFSMYR